MSGGGGRWLSLSSSERRVKKVFVVLYELAIVYSSLGVYKRYCEVTSLR